jgi:quercetin dioxygenase-like cupin family protein
MGSNRTPLLLRHEEGEALWGIDGSLMTIKATADQTRGMFTLVEEIGQRGEGTPLHVHGADDEAFYILDGTVVFHLGGKPPFEATKGAFVHIPGGTTHAFRIASETARYLIITTPQHLAFYQAISEPAPERSLPPMLSLDMEKVEAACAAYGVDILGPPPGSEADSDSA